MTTAATRQRLPNRREQFTETIVVRDKAYDTSVGFDSATGQPKELFFAGAKEGSEMAAVLADAAVIVSIALQWGVPPAVLAHSLAREPVAGPAADDGGTEIEMIPASPIGAAVDLLVSYAGGPWAAEGIGRPYDEHADALGSFHDAVKEIGRRVKAGEPLPQTSRYFGRGTEAAE